MHVPEKNTMNLSSNNYTQTAQLKLFSSQLPQLPTSNFHYIQYVYPIYPISLHPVCMFVVFSVNNKKDRKITYNLLKVKIMTVNTIPWLQYLPWPHGGDRGLICQLRRRRLQSYRSIQSARPENHLVGKECCKRDTRSRSCRSGRCHSA